MAFSAGVYSLTYNWTSEAASPPIEIAKLDTEMAGIATGLSSCLLRDGTGLPTASIPFNSQKITGLGNATLAQDAAAAIQVQNGSLLALGTVAGTADVITANLTPALAAYVSKQIVTWTPSGTNTTNVTLNVNGLGAKAVVKHNNVALVAGDLKTAVMAIAIYDGTSFVLQNPLLAHTANADAAEPGFKGVPQNSQSGNYSTVLTDAGKDIFHPSGAGAGHTYTIDAAVAYPTETIITFTNFDSNTISIALSAGTMVLAGTSTTGTRTLAVNGIASARKVTANSWIIAGTGVS